MTANMDDRVKTANKPGKLSGPQQVVAYLNHLDHPLKNEIEEVRKIILSANHQITEHIKWNAPSFCYQNDDRFTLNLHGKGFFRLVFHCGVKVKETVGNKPLFDDNTGLLDWVANDRAIVKFTDMTDVEGKKSLLK